MAFTPSGDAFTSAAEIGAVTAIEFLSDWRMVAAAEPVRRGGRLRDGAQTLAEVGPCPVVRLPCEYGDSPLRHREGTR